MEINNDHAIRIRQKTLAQHKHDTKQDNQNNILSFIMILTLIIGLSMIATIYCINWYVLPNIITR